MPTQDLEKVHDERAIQADVSTIISILPVGIDESKPGLIPTQYRIKGVQNPLEDVETLQVVRARFPVYLDENRPALIVPAPSDTVAESICRDYKISMAEYSPGVAEPGLFWARGAYTPISAKLNLKEELQRARDLQLTWFKRLVEVGDDDWNRYHMRRAISTIQRLACATLKLEKPWNQEQEITANLAMKPCKFCFADVHPEAIICTHCRGILNMERYRAEYKEVVTK